MIKPNDLRKQLTDEQVVKVLFQLGATEVREHNDYLSFRTVCHNEDETDGGFNLAYYKENKSFYCFSRCGYMNIFQVVQNHFALGGEDSEGSFYNAFYFVLNHSDFDTDPLLLTSKKEVILQSPEYTPQGILMPYKPISNLLLETFNKSYPAEWLDDGISKAAMDRFNIRFSISQNKVVIPHYDANGFLIGIRGRALNSDEVKEFGKYAPMMIEGRIYSHALGFNLYGLNFNKNNIKRNGIAIVAEGEKAPLQAEALLPDNNIVTSVCGNRINRWQVLLLLAHCNVKEIILAFDREEEDGKDDYFNYLYRMCKQYKPYCDFSFLYDNKNLKMKENVFDRKDPLLLREMLHRRIRVR